MKAMRLPAILAEPTFQLIYAYLRKKEGATSPPIKRVITPVNGVRKQSFDDLLQKALTGDPRIPIHYELPFPKIDFLNYICDWRGYVLHGSPLHDLDVLQPIRKSSDNNEFGNRQQIFCSPDANWAMWFAILEKGKFNLTRNGSLRVGRDDRRIKYYHFELPKSNKEDPPFTEGMIYIARAEDFPDKRPYPILEWFDAEVEEWGSTRPVSPLARIRVSPQDFPYLDKVQFSL